MAMLTQKAFGSLGPTNAGIVPQITTTSLPSVRRPAPSMNQSFALSPTDSEFSDGDSPDLVKNWDEDRVCEYLRSVRCGEYEKVFRKHHINGENLLEIDKEVLKEIGVEKVGDRVRLFLSIKKLRTKSYTTQKKRAQDLYGASDNSQFSHSPSSSHANNSRPHIGTSNRQYSRSYQDSLAPSDAGISMARAESPSRPSSSRRYPSSGNVSNSGNSTTNNGYGSTRSPPGNTMSSRLASSHTRNNSSMDGSLMAGLPQDQDVIRVISNGGVTKVVKISDCNTCEEVMRVTLRKFALREDYERNYCFWVLTGLEPDPNQCRRLGDTELWRIIKDQTRPERNRLILRRVSASEPGEAELDRAAQIALQESQQIHMRAIETQDNKRSQLKVQKLLGENWNEGLKRPIARNRYTDSPKDTDNGFDTDSSMPTSMRRKNSSGSVLRPFGGLRPPSELITSDLTSYFPDHAREDIDRTARLSVRRSTRLSRVNHRLSVASTLSFASTIQDAPPIPTIADSWLNTSLGTPKGHVPSRLGNFRDSVASSVLEPLAEEAGDRKSFLEYPPGTVEPTVINVTDPDGHTMMRRSYYGDDGATIGSGSGSGSIQELQEALNEDGEELDEELQSFLSGESWDDNKWMKGALIGKGSFGSVYLALHAITGELLAVKQVQAPTGNNSPADQRKKSMIDALKREISLLRDLKHPNIVQYLGCGTSAEYLNIFLEYVPGGSVQTMLNSYGALPEPLVRSFVRQILTGLSYLHERDIIHRDIKGANILVDNKGTIKISDFGISKKIEASNILNGANNAKNRPSLQGSVFWMAPEVVRQTSYTRKADIWSLGCLVVEMMTGTHPFPDCTQLQAIFKIGGSKATPTVPENASAEAKEFLGKTFLIDHDQRPNADELMLSSFLAPVA
ncbi:hypothetical protein TD95_005037 [Thielaviopsis punctulata]|uniref:mitogen-activated protein kinase kinase kinase n=1 Tax=Thielaviopsis punctulata TaxID=72032 RepID=A0A0F4ZJ47_9PEZI|nr:hypothetical protein TD95_005037 [Thielaviopsis punctulata]